MFDQAWKPFVLERAEREGVDRLIARVLTYFAVLALGPVVEQLALVRAP